MPSIGAGCSSPFATRRRRPAFSVINMRPSGRNATDHGCTSPSTTRTTRKECSCERMVWAETAMGRTRRIKSNFIGQIVGNLPAPEPKDDVSLCCRNKGGVAFPQGDSMYDIAPCVTVVDDDAAVLKSLGRLLRAAGFAVRTFPSSQEFLQ